MTELTEAQTIVLDHAKKQYERNLKTWAIDRALETLKILPQKEVFACDVTAAADVLCGYVCETPKEFPIPTENEAEAMLADMQSKGEA